MNFMIDSACEMPYRDFAMQNLLILKKRAEAQIRAIQADIDAMDKVLGLENKYTEESTSKLVANLRRNRSGKDIVHPEDIEKTALTIDGQFRAADVRLLIKKMFPGSICSETAVNSALNRLIKIKKLKFIEKRSGRRPAIYHKA